MQYFKDKDNQIYAYDDNVTMETINELNPGLTRIEESQIADIQDPTGEQRTFSIYSDLMSQVRQGFESVVDGRPFEPYIPYQLQQERGVVDTSHYQNEHFGHMGPSNYSYDSTNPYSYDPYSGDNKYPKAEQDTFELQYKEAKAFEATNWTDRSVCPNITVLATTRGIDLVEFAKKIISKHEGLDNNKIKYLGLKQKYTDIVEAAKGNREELNKLGLSVKDWLIYK